MPSVLDCLYAYSCVSSTTLIWLIEADVECTRVVIIEIEYYLWHRDDCGCLEAWWDSGPGRRDVTNVQTFGDHGPSEACLGSIPSRPETFKVIETYRSSGHCVVLCNASDAFDSPRGLRF